MRYADKRKKITCIILCKAVELAPVSSEGFNNISCYSNEKRVDRRKKKMQQGEGLIGERSQREKRD